MKASDFLTDIEKKEIVEAIKAAEHDTSGEIRVHIEMKCKTEILDRSAFLFAKLKMHKTALRNGVLFYLAIEDQKFSIIGDAGINRVVPPNFWEETKSKMQEYFVQGKFAAGLVHGIMLAGEKLKAYYPYEVGDINELPDDISFGKD
jgi:uncharacterized membrane protein